MVPEILDWPLCDRRAFPFRRYKLKENAGLWQEKQTAFEILHAPRNPWFRGNVEERCAVLEEGKMIASRMVTALA